MELAFCAPETTIVERLNSADREDTRFFKMPLNGDFYNALTMHASSDNICSWIGKVQDCSILRSSSLDVPFQEFKTTSPLPVFFESDEEVEQANDIECTENLKHFLTKRGRQRI